MRHFIGSLWIARRQGLAGDLLVGYGQLEQHAAGLDVGDPPLRRALAGTHAGLGRLLGQRTVRVDVDPHLAATLDVPGHGDTGGLDLAVGDVGRLEGLDAVVTERRPWCHPWPRRDGSGWCCLRCLTLRGINMVRPPSRAGGSRLRRRLGRRGLGRRPRRPRPTSRLARARRCGRRSAPGRPPATRRRGCRRQLGLALGLGAGHDVALVDPDLHADAAEGGPGLVEAVVDVGAQRVQRHAALAVELACGSSRRRRGGPSTGPGCPWRRRVHRRLHAPCASRGGTPRGCELLGDALGDQLRVELGVLDLEDVQLHLLAGELLEVAADAVGLGAAAADDDARARGVDVDADAVTGALDLDAAMPARSMPLAMQLPDRDVLGDVVLA